ncbi:PucR family transcriptional regulator [Paenarthrobacter sp. NPDC089675]|uniref:PucR family transcriptional regulator n=1 Tax=Paenarthrobacter TaxID=1742992 RepID=UPI0038052047
MTEGLLVWLPQVFPALADERYDQAAMAASINDNLRTMWSMVANDLSPDFVEPPPSALAFPRRLVHDNVPASVLLRVYYVGHAMIWHRWVIPELASISRPQPFLAVVEARLHGDIFNYLDRAALRVLEQYEAEKAELRSFGGSSRSVIAYDVLSGSVLSASARRRLEFALDKNHLAWVLWAQESPLDFQEGLADLGGTVHDILGRGDRLAIFRGPNELWGWTGLPVAMTENVRGSLLHALDNASSKRSGAGFHLAVGSAGYGEVAFRDGLADARAIQSAVVAAGRRSPSVYTVKEAGLATLLLANPLAASRFMRTHLKGLQGVEPNAVLLRQTIQEFLATGGSYAKTAERLGVHRNTVLYRLQRAEKELGVPIQPPADDLAAALLIADWGLTADSGN